MNIITDSNHKNNKEWLSAEKLKLSLGFHWPEGEKPASRYNRESFLKAIEATGMQAVTIEAKDELGYLYYDASTGIRHPEVNWDYFGERLEALKSKGIKVTAYFGCGGNYIDGIGHPEYLMQFDPKKPRGEPLVGEHVLMSLNSAYFDDVFLPQVKDFLGKYVVDAIWFDIFSVDPYWGVSYDAATKTLFQNRLGRPLLPPDQDPDPVETGAFFIERASEVRKRILSELNPWRERTAIAISSHYRFLRHDGIVTDYLSRDTFRGYCGDIFESSYYARLWAEQPVPSEIISPITRWWGEWDAKSSAQLIREAAAALAAGSTYNLYGMTRADGFLCPERCRRIGMMKNYIDSRMPWFEAGKPAPEALLLLDTESEEAFSRKSLTRTQGTDLDSQTNNFYFTQTHECASAMLQRWGYDFGIRTDVNWQAGSADSEARLIIAGHLSEADQALAEKLLKFSEDGGVLVLMGHLSRAMEQTFGVHFEPVSPALPRSYLKSKLSTEVFSELEIPIPVRRARTEFPGARVLADLFPVIAEDQYLEHKHPFGYSDADLDQPHPSVFLKSQGKGSILYFGFNVFTSYADEPSADLADFFSSVLQQAGFEKRYQIEDNVMVELVRWKSMDESKEWLHLVNHAESYRTGRGGKQYPGEKIPAIRNLTLTAKGTPPSSVKLQPEGAVISPTQTDDCWSLKIPELHIHGIVELTFDQ